MYFINPKIHEITSERNALKLINNTLPLHGFSIQDFGLPDNSSELMEYNDDIEDDICTHTLINPFTGAAFFTLRAKNGKTIW